ncbi:GLPGLI family protein [Halpernia sp. GG3]
MQKLSLIFLLIIFAAHAQNTRVIYEYKFKSDSLSKDSLKKEWMYLDIDKNGSKFYSKSKFENDSIMIESVRKQLAINSKNLSISRQSNSGDVDFSVDKIYPDYQIFLNTNVDNDKYRVLEDRKLVWKILPQDDKIENYKVQKATTDFAGRKWTAWFTTEIPIQDGPYKFQGLPGLILKMEDASKTHEFLMKGLKKFSVVASDEIKSEKVPAFFNRKPLEVSRKQYLVQLEKYRKDPVQGMREMLNMPNSKVKININGQEFSEPKDVLREMEKNAKAEMAKNNNKIELKP